MDMNTYIKPLTKLEDYAPLVGDATIERLARKAERLRDLHVVNVNSTYYGGGVAELLSSLTLLMNGVGIRTGWRVMQGRPDFFSVTKKIHNALQGADINLSALKMEIYEEVALENAARNHFDHDIVVIHDPQPLPMINCYEKKSPWIWRCHVEISDPHAATWAYLSKFVEKFDAAIFSTKEYSQNLTVPQLFFLPAIDPFAPKNIELSDAAMDDRLSYYDIPTDLPLIVQVSRFDHFKDPDGVIDAFQLARQEIDATLVLVGNVATDDPEGQEVFESICARREERVVILACQDSALVNTLQRRAAVIVQKSLREGFGLTVTEAMWKGTPVIGGNVGGIRHQISDGDNGFLVSSVAEAAARMVQLVGDEDLRRRMGARARESVRQRFLMTRLLEQYLDLFASFQVNFTLRNRDFSD